MEQEIEGVMADLKVVRTVPFGTGLESPEWCVSQNIVRAYSYKRFIVHVDDSDT